MNNKLLLFPALFAGACIGAEPSGIAPALPADTTVKLDFEHRPLPEIPLPNDIATRFDPNAATGLRVNASMIAPTSFERRVRTLVDEIDGWGVFQTITIPFTAPLDVESILRGHRDENFDFSNDVIYLINVDRDSADFGKIHHLDLGNGNYPVVLERQEYWKNDPRGWTLSLAYEETNEDLDGDGQLDPGEDTDADGELDYANYLPGLSPARDNLAGRADALMTFYERQTNTLIARPMVPLDERTTYAVVVTRRLLDAAGNPVGSPYPWINHASQTPALEPLLEVLPEGLSVNDLAFAYTFTTQSVESEWIPVRDGLYGHGVKAHLAAEFPAELAALEPLRDKKVFTEISNPYVLYTEDVYETMAEAAVEWLGQDDDSSEFADFMQSERYIDFHVIGSFDSPQLFQRRDERGNLLPLDAQSWPPDLAHKPAPARAEKVYFWLTVPRKEVSARGEGKPAPIVILSHGYTSSRLELMRFSGEFARHGFATLAIDCVSHGIGLNPIEQAVIEGLFAREGLTPFLQAVFKDRAEDQNNDSVKDSGADFWTAYLFHTRDVVRQSVLDHMQLVRIFRGFDGQKRWKLDVNGDGTQELAGDFDGDGTVDAGGPESLIGMTGGSLGGIMSTAVGALEPGIEMTVPIAGGGGLSDVGIRSQQGGVREAVGLRLLGPLFVGTTSGDGKMLVETIVPDLNDDRTLALAEVDGVLPGDTFLVTNERTGERGCGYVSPEGTVRAAVATDIGDPLSIGIYRGDILVPGARCVPSISARPKHLIDRFQQTVIYQQQRTEIGAPLVSLAEGYGLPRAHPKLRRFMSLSQLVLDPSDPGVLARHLLEKPITYPGTGEKTGAHAIIVTTVGDMNVPASTGGTIGRAAGLIDYLTPLPAHGGKTANQILLDTHTYEAVNTYGRYKDAGGTGVHVDVENFSEGDDLWTEQNIPRLDPPLRIGLDKTDVWGGISSAMFPYPIPTGQHGFAFPGEQTDTLRRRCARSCTAADGCGCATLRGFDLGHFMFNMLGHYFASGGKTLSTDRCYARNDCPTLKPAPEPRPADQLR